ncbi:MAG TPA: FAD-dependent oxidoreductase [Aggregatilinea sp.]|uniref:FAD-dependent oxidoreductase n=1 Tax=Aggregatilinea sp. TaxID=2806333 RepID=UPI002BC19B2F|nr:FAD-dependent oxidoreductase [Aggregatilinea sp.]HML21598.1 FAD-dependent oxidoreductase [Aggregatilinea sp.]
MKDTQTDILIVGAGMGGTAAALAALRLGRRVILTEETDWIGGQLTAQIVPPDENPWIDTHHTGCTASYRRLRDGIRDVYRRSYPMLPEIKARPFLNPGSGNVSPLCHEPRISVAMLNEMILPYLANGQLTLWLRTIPVGAETDGDTVRAVTLESLETGEQTTVHTPYIIDATELGDLLELAGVEHVMGAESQAETGEPHALEGNADPMDQQSHSWCFALSYYPGEDHTIDKPEEYDFWRQYKADFWPDRMLSWTTSDPETLAPIVRPIFSGPTDDAAGTDLWHYRRIAFRKFYPAGFHRSDIVVVNWPQLDYWLGPLVGVSDEERQKNLRGARQLSLSLMYWMQTEAPTQDGGQGYPGLRMRGDVTDTPDGLAKYPYIRESRRIKAEFTVLEQHVGVEARGSLQGAEQFADTVGIGSYRIDLHPSYRRNYVDITNWPHQIPLGALIPQRVENLLPGNKNLGVTHITNGCYRLHPVEWTIGEAAGALAAHCLNTGLVPRQVRNTPQHLADFQALLVEQLGFVLEWPEALRLTPRVKFDPIGI